MRELNYLAADLRAGKINRFDFLRGAAGLGITVAVAASALDPFNAMQVMAAVNPNITPAHPKMKAKRLIGFSQSELDNGWRSAETNSMAAFAKTVRGRYDYVPTLANGDTNKQVSDVGDLVAQHCDLIVISPREEMPLRAANAKALAAGIPVILIDRDTGEKPGTDFVTAIESNFIVEGQRVANYLVAQSSGPINYVELRGSTGATPAIQRGQGFHGVVDKLSRFKQLDSEDGDFVLTTAKKIMTSWITKFGSKIDMIYSHNDAMTMGAIQAMKEAGFTKKVYIGSMDGQKNVISLVAKGVVTICVQCNPNFGPVTFGVIDEYFAGKAIPGHIINHDNVYTKSTASALLSTGF
ncbi:MAG TPA: ABC transporter substrate-binding protein [Chloroflexota bacterium]|nr:ABC transporter substrate-binding protein [Chloroflexota bacterium]